MDLDVAAIAQTKPVGTLDLNQILLASGTSTSTSSIHVHVASAGIQAISHVVGAEIQPGSFFVAVYISGRLPRVLGAGVGAAVLVAGVGIDSQPLARFVIIIIIILIRGIRRCGRDSFFRRQHLPPPLLLVPKPVEVVQIRVGIPEELSKGIVVPPVVHQVLDGTNAPYFGIDDVVPQLEP